jgi:predicted  nucleic acid-binding Zn-ribbon protein
MRVDQQTVERLQLMAPGVSAADSREVHGLVISGQVFSEFTAEERELIWNKLKAFDRLIPSLYTFFEDFKYFTACAECIQRLLVTNRNQPTIYSAMGYMFQPETAECRILINESSQRTVHGNYRKILDVSYRELWLFAMRHYPQMAKDPQRDDLLAKVASEKADEAVVYEMAKLAKSLGFESAQINSILSKSPDRQIAAGALLKARKPGRYQYDLQDMELLIDTIVDCFTHAKRTHDDATPELLADNDRQSQSRCGLPQLRVHKQDLGHLFFDRLETTEGWNGEQISTLFIRRCVYLAFFGPCSIPAVPTPEANSPLFCPIDAVEQAEPTPNRSTRWQQTISDLQSRLKESEAKLREQFNMSQQRLRDVEDNLQQQLENCQRSEARLRSELEKTQGSESSLRIELEKAQTSEASLRIELEKAQGSGPMLTNELREARESKARLRIELEKAQRSEESLTDELREARESEARLRSELEKTQGSEARLRIELEKAQRSEASLTDELREARESEARLRSGLEKTQGSEAQRLEASLKHELQEARESESRLRSELEKARGDLEKSQGSEARLKDELREARESAEGANKQLHQATSKRESALQEQWEQIQKELRECKMPHAEQANTVQQLFSSQEAEIKKLQTHLSNIFAFRIRPFLLFLYKDSKWELQGGGPLSKPGAKALMKQLWQSNLGLLVYTNDLRSVMESEWNAWLTDVERSRDYVIFMSAYQLPTDEKFRDGMKSLIQNREASLYRLLCQHLDNVEYQTRPRKRKLEDFEHRGRSLSPQRRKIGAVSRS